MRANPTAFHERTLLRADHTVFSQNYHQQGVLVMVDALPYYG
ncbi:hypothetical protein HMPREF1861_00342 [Corynebacterium kroppenstedtii]|nr:hypothetical protein HMPREF1861_00342 [Corynebacterium kroppenstedtii]